MTITSSLRAIQGVANTAQGASDVLGRLSSGSFWSQLKPAAYRGIAFGVKGGIGHLGNSLS